MFERLRAWLDSGFKEAGPPGGSHSGGGLDGVSELRMDTPTSVRRLHISP